MQEIQTCYRHDGRRAGVRCQRCARPICPDCMRQASVGFHCPACASGASGRVVTGDQLRRRWSQPVVTQVLIALNVTAFVVVLLGGGSMSGVGLSDLENRFALLGSLPLVDGQLSGSLVVPAGLGEMVGVAHGEWWRLVTGAFLHGGLLHLGFNMYVLWILGPQLEQLLGRGAFLAVYGVSLLAGSFGALLMDPFVPTVGASGAIYGLFGAALVLQRRQGINPLASGLGAIVAINLLLTFAIPGISIGGHLGGLAGGALAGMLVVEAMARRQPALGWLGCAALAGVCVLGAVWAAEQAWVTLEPVLAFG